MIKKIKAYYNKYDKTIHCLDGISISIIIACNIWVITRPLPPAEIAFWWLLMNLIGFLIGLPIAWGLLSTIFKPRLIKLVDNFIDYVRNEKNGEIDN
jgi:hypothetical protein